MLDESKDQILGRIIKLAKADASLCKMLMGACVSMKDEEAAEILLKRLRAHVDTGSDSDKLYNVENYLEYVEDLVDLVSEFKHVPIMKGLHEHVRDTYEVLLYNKIGLYAALQELKRQDHIDAMRENYWMN